MATTPSIELDHFEGGKNLTKGQRAGEDSINSELFQAVRVDIVAIEADVTTLEAKPVTMDGSAAIATIIQAGQPTATDTLEIGSDTYEFDGAGSNINVTIGASAEATLTNLVSAINTSGTESIVAEKLSATTAAIRSAAAAGGAVAAADPSIVLDSSSATNYSFDCGDVNMNTLAGVDDGPTAMCATTLTITTAMITAGSVRIAFPFTPRVLQITALNATGVLELAITDTFVIDDDDVVITLNGGAGDLANTDVVHLSAWA